MKIILLVDDDQGVLGVLTSLLEENGYRVLLAFDGREALVRLSQVLPDLVISDYTMPFMNGLQLSSAMQNNEAYHMIPFVLMSARPEATIAAITSEDDIARTPDMLGPGETPVMQVFWPNHLTWTTSAS